MGQNKWKKAVVFLCTMMVLCISFWYGNGSEESLEIGNQESTISGQADTPQNAEKSENENTASGDRGSEESKEETTFFEEIVMNIKAKKRSNESSDKKKNTSKTQANKKANDNANKAVKKAKKSQKKSTESSKKTKSDNQGNTVNNKNQETTNTDVTENTASQEEGIQCTISISCKVLLEHMEDLPDSKKKYVPEDGVILDTTTINVKEGSTVFDVLKNVTKSKKIHFEYAFTPMFKSYYIEGIANLYEFDAGDLSGWMYSVNDEFQSCGSSSCEVRDGDEIRWMYTCNLGKDIGSYFEE